MEEEGRQRLRESPHVNAREGTWKVEEKAVAKEDGRERDFTASSR